MNAGSAVHHLKIVSEASGTASRRSGLEAAHLAPAANRSPLPQWLTLVWIASIFALYLVHTLHLRADFPNFSPWMDYAKYTDEGWYGNAAIEHFVRGSWYVPGDFNTAAALPVWPLLEWVVFHFTGVGIVAARGLAIAVFGANLLLCYWLVRSTTPEKDRQWTALLAVTLLAASSFLYSFSRLAILEPLLTFLTLLSWLLLLRLPRLQTPFRRSLLLIVAGLVYCLMILTKTTAVFLLPSLLYLLWFPLRRDRRAFFHAAGTFAAAAAVSWGSYFFLLVRPRFLDDYKYLFYVNVYLKPTTLRGWLATFWYALHGTLWIDRLMVPLVAVLLLYSLFRLRSLWRNPLFGAAFLAVAGYVFFIGYHNNMQPRYYAFAAVPLFLMAAIAASELLRQQRILGILALAAIALACLLNLRQTLSFARHPQYTFVTAAEGVTRYIDQHPNGNRLLLSISGNDITLITGLPSICDDFGTIDLPTRIYNFRPGWYAAWNEIDAGTLQDLETQYTLEAVASYPAFDDPDRNLLILYKLHPLPPAQQRTLAEIEGLPPAPNTSRH
jgi:4-amino-4-deoxy-L-arabinose transferase-like glycosyltransferase